MPQLAEYRENAARSITICGEITEALVHQLTAPISKLRCENSDPITVYINSGGGFVHYAEQIRHLLKAPRQDGAICRTITVATNRADSAAAGLLALGDYAIAFPDARIHCHGVRLAHREITSQRAQDLAAALKQDDDDFALLLAKRAFSRLAFHFANLRSGFEQTNQQYSIYWKEKGEDRQLESELECFACEINMRLSRQFQKLPQKAFFNQKRLIDIQNYVFATPLGTEENAPLANKEAVLLSRLLEYELKHNDLSEWNLSGGGIDDLSLDFQAFADYMFGPHTDTLDDQLDSYGAFFLTADQTKEFVTRQKDDAEVALNYLRDSARPLVAPMWYFVVSLCRLLQSGENPLTAIDAYWLGIVDEVVGEHLPSFRLIAESVDPSLKLSEI